MAGNRFSIWRYGRKKKALLLSALSLYLLGSTSAGYAHDVNVNKPGRAATGIEKTNDSQTTFNEDVNVNVHGSGGGWKYNVTGISLTNGAEMTINGNLKLRLLNDDPAVQGTTKGADVAHYYMSGIYAGFGGNGHGETKFTLNGTADLDVVGVALQANKDAHITVRGGKVRTHIVRTSETYALLAEEGSVYMNTGADGATPGSEDVDVYGNLGVLNKNYGKNPNPGNRASHVSLALTTANSKLTGGVLNEFAENGTNPKDSGVDLYLQNGASWENRWLWTQRPAAVQDRANKESYLYTGSKIRKLIGGSTEAAHGTIFQREDKPVTVDHYSGHQRVFYGRDADGGVFGGDFIVKHAEPGSSLTLTTDKTWLNPASADAAEQAKVNYTLNALANKLRYKNYASGERNLTGKVEIAESLTAPSAALKVGSISYKSDGQGEYIFSGTSTKPSPAESSSWDKKIEKHEAGAAVGHASQALDDAVWTGNVLVDVSGKSVAGGSESNEVTGVSLVDGSSLTVRGKLTVKVKNEAPATKGADGGADLAHAYMSGIYAGRGGGQHDDTRFTLRGDLDMDVIGVGLQAGRNGRITVDGGKIVTHELSTSDTYALLAEEGSVFMNTGTDGKTPGAKKVDIYGNLGTLNKNYGTDKNPGDAPSLISLALTTADSKLTGGVLNEFAENRKGAPWDAKTSGVDIYLKNGAVWQNKWLGAERIAVANRPASKGKPNAYLYTGSKIRNLFGGASAAEAGAIFQQEAKPITIENYSGYQRVIYGRAADGSLFGGNFVIQHAEPDSHVILRTDNSGIDTASTEKAAKAFNDLAAKLYYMDYIHGGENLTGTLEIAESLTAPSASKTGYIEFDDRTGKGLYTTEPADPPFTPAKTIEKHTDEQSVGATIGENEQQTWEGNTLVNVSGASVANGRRNNYVTGILLDEGGQLTVNGDLKVRVKNTAPATRGDTATKATAHYRMSGIHAALGGKLEDEEHDHTRVTVNGRLDMNVVGTGLQAGKDSHITVRGGKIRTHALTTSDTYALLAEEGTVFMNSGADGKTPGTDDVDVYGNLGTLNTNFAQAKLMKNPGEHQTLVSLALTTGKSKLTGGILNEFAENGKNPHDSGIDLHLKNGAAWQNRWIGAKRVSVTDRPVSDGAPKSYLYTGSKLRNLFGGASKAEAGTIFQQEENPVTVDRYSGYQKVIYEHNAKGRILGGDFIVKQAAPGSFITLRTDNTGLDTTSTNVADRLKVNDMLNSLAGKLHYLAYKDGERNLTGQVEIAEGLTAPATALKIGNISYQADGQGAYKSTEPLTPPTTERKIEKHSSGASIGYRLIDNKKEFWNDNVTVNVSGSGLGSQHKNVTGFYLLDGGQLTISGNLKLNLANSDPATRGAAPGADVAHYYMSGVYAGYGGLSGDGDNEASKFTLHGDLDMDVVGIGLQANKDGFITVGGGKIVTHALSTSDTYAMLAEEGSVFMNTGTDGTAPGRKTVDITGNLGVIHKNYGMDPNPDKHGSFISLALPTATSKLTGAILNEYEENGSNTYDSGVDLYLTDGAQWNNKWLGAHRAKAAQPRADAESYLYKGSKVRNLTGGATEDVQGNIFQQEENPITVKNYSGYERITYGRNADGTLFGGDFIVRHAAPGSFITLRTDNTGLDTASTAPAEKAKVNRMLNVLAGKLRYTGYTSGERNLKGRVEIAEGLTAPSLAQKVGDISYKADGQGEFTGEARMPDIIYGDKETRVMRSAKSAITASALFWRDNNNDLQRRLGDLRLGKDAAGIWVRYLGGKSSMHEQKVDMSQTYNIVQVGYDRKIDDWTVGVAGEYGKSSLSYASGSGTAHLGGLALYGVWQGKDGDYFDVIGKLSSLQNKYKVFNDMGHWIDADYRTSGVSLSMEYGRKFAQKSGFYVEPSAELIFSHLGGKNYDAPSDIPGKLMHVQQDGMNSAISRLGIGIGQQTKKSNAFLKLALAHEFNGTIRNTFRADSEPTGVTKVDLKDTWIDLELGGSCQVSDNAYVYGTFTKNFGATLKTDWRADLGVRILF
nr:autotransporter outer membrane beta-barrel domain-containing protein [uncultured Selenomonas sp.]